MVNVTMTLSEYEMYKDQKARIEMLIAKNKELVKYNSKLLHEHKPKILIESVLHIRHTYDLFDDYPENNVKTPISEWSSFRFISDDDLFKESGKEVVNHLEAYTKKMREFLKESSEEFDLLVTTVKTLKEKLKKYEQN